jgi:hypothetical protein
VLSFGLILFPALAGLRRLDFARLPVVVAVSAIALGLFLLFFVRISEASWVGFRAGQILLISIPILLARALWLLGPRWGALLAAAVLVIGAPTTIVDTWNAQDIGNRRQGPGFRWTIWTTAAQERAFAWLRTHTPSDAVVQMEPMVRAREHWTLIPSFAGRRMAAGLPISLLPMPEYTEASTRVQRMFATSDVREAQSIARSLRLDYVYMDAADTNAYPDGTRKFDADANMFELVFESDDVRIYRVQ